MHDCYSFVFLSDLLIWFGQLDRFFLAMEEVLCNEFDLAVLNPSDRRGHDTYYIVAIKEKRWDLFMREFTLSTSCQLA